MNEIDSSIRRGRAYVRLIEAADTLIVDERQENDREVLEAARQLAIAHLRFLMRDCDRSVTVQILMASDKKLGTVKDVGLN